MAEHKWKQSHFDCSGEFNGMKTCIQIWTCSICKTQMRLPMGVGPKDYEETICVAPPPEIKKPWKCPIKGDKSVSKTYPAKKKTTAVKGDSYGKNA